MIYLMIPRLHLNEFVRPGEAYHFARVALTSKPAKEMHRHSFHEIFWVEEGEGIHAINGQRRSLYPGLCFFIHANDAHSLWADAGHSLRIVNVAFPSHTWLALRRRYFSGHRDFFTGPVAAREMNLKSVLSTELSTAAEELEQGDRSRLNIERFLINFLHRVAARSAPDSSSPLPDWLERACRLIRENRAFAGGVPALAKLAGRCPEHLARQVRHYMDKTPTDIVNEARLAYASGELAGNRRPISEIAFDCGIENLSHFYDLFRRRSGCTPRQYRLRHQRIAE
jgi:AraC family cel operon transcriptional repressor